MDEPTGSTHTSQQILDIAQRLVQTRGYNAFSYADIAQALNITKASLHYHFPTKERLGQSLIDRYRRAFVTALAAIDSAGGATPERLRRFAAIYSDVLADHRMCLCGMLTAEFETLPKSMQTGLESFFALNEKWLASVLSEGRIRGELRFQGSPVEVAQYMIAALEGAMMMARADGHGERFRLAAGRLLASFGA
jgi:TetR/AcrR family transcriptional repressor of nem operon